jgi:3-hydroxyacyl-CoA dehydrogenase
VIGTHFFSPANVMKLLEVVRGEKTAKDVLATVMALAKKIRKTAVVSGVCDGFIGNRMIEQYSRQAGFLLEEGCTPAQVDKAIEKFGLAMGPFRMGDLAGNDIGWAIRKRRYVEQPGMRYSKTADLLCEMGRYGQKTGAGWYDYQPGKRDAIPSAGGGEDDRGPPRRAWASRRARSATTRSCTGWSTRWSTRRQDPGRGHRQQGQRHRHGLPHRLRLPAAPRRPHVLRRPAGPVQRRAGDEALRRQPA